MTLIGQDVLVAACRRNKPLRSALEAWKAVAEGSEWHSLDDVRKSYPSADGVVLGSRTVVTVFNLKGNHYRLISSIDYDAQIVESLEVVTHAEYDKNLWKVRY